MAILNPLPLTGLLAASLLACGCAAVQPAHMVLPAGLQDRTEQLSVSGLGGGRSGTFTLGAASGHFVRQADRVSLIDNLAIDRGGAQYTLQQPGAAEVQGTCRTRQATVQAGAVAGNLSPYIVTCQWRDGARLTLDGDPRAARTQDGRRGRYEAAGVLLELNSVHELQGSALPLAQPIGYTFIHQGTAVGAVEINGNTPVLWRPRAGQPLHDAVTQAALAVALLWDPAAITR